MLASKLSVLREQKVSAQKANPAGFQKIAAWPGKELRFFEGICVPVCARKMGTPPRV
jgi:hypothetical protein